VVGLVPSTLSRETLRTWRVFTISEYRATENGAILLGSPANTFWSFSCEPCTTQRPTCASVMPMVVRKKARVPDFTCGRIGLIVELFLPPTWFHRVAWQVKIAFSCAVVTFAPALVVVATATVTPSRAKARKAKDFSVPSAFGLRELRAKSMHPVVSASRADRPAPEPSGRVMTAQPAAGRMVLVPVALKLYSFGVLVLL